jgi:hypothetical protein
MRSIDCLGLLLILTCSISAQSPEPPKPAAPQNLQTGYCPQTRQLEAEPSQKFFLDGTIGKRRVRMFLDRGGSTVVGLFFYLSSDWTPTSLGGEWNNGNIEMSDATETHPATGTLKASLAANRLTGTWIAVNSTEPEPVRLVDIPEPRCDGHEKWKRFKDPKWPVSFSYPESWHIEQSGRSATVTCPNPANIAYQDQVTIYAGTGDPDGPPDEPTSLLKCGDTWRYGESSCDCSRPDSLVCGTAKITRKHSATILDVSDREWRVYCRNGGYVAQGEGQDRIVLLDGNWIEIIGQGKSSEIVDRLIDTVTARKSSQSQ